MCGRYASARKRIELLEEFGVQRDRVDKPLEPDYNVAPTKPVYAVLTRSAHGGRNGRDTGDTGDTRDTRDEATAGPAADEPMRELRVVRWGLVPAWAKDPSIGSRLINARAETVSEKPAFRSAFARRRCLLPADGYFEWQRIPADPQAGTRAAKQPYFITRADGGPLAFAGLYELWRDRDRDAADPSAWLWTATIITTSAPDELGQIHDRMPMVVDPRWWPDWLDPAAESPAELLPLLAPAMTTGLTSYPVSAEVNSVRNNGPGLIKPLQPAAPAAAGPGGGGNGPAGHDKLY